jgi:hypothetical protein
MSKRTISWILVAHLLVCWTAVTLRNDHFPLTWAPMYAVYVPPPGSEYQVQYIDKQWLKEKGWLAKRRDGSHDWINQGDVNLPKRMMRRLYYERMQQVGPPNYDHLNHDANTIDRWLWGLEPGENFLDVDWHRRLLTAMNKTFGLTPDDPEFIVSLESKGERFRFERGSLAYLGKVPDEAIAVWNETWRDDF